ncbi:aminotransferase class IV [Streptomyces phyllanthi]|uniref:Aminotransferase class IV n=1 Tax=Streptomyces phyllanthi TaxID=1803180 RepID=A0A5N8WAE1_9ACTN|nr:aminotransferase class IV [Streptomyces phyllanthi]MPY43324.1 aminotransferase class IV [Streptomyces phyllanthi]
MTQPAIAEGLLAWSPDRGLTSGPPASGRLLVADSWLLSDGRMRGFARHRERFLRSCGDCGAPPLRRLIQFWHDVTAALPRSGDWFPRVELTAGSLELRLLLRQAPLLGTDVRVWAAGQLDPRTVPRRKGPDLDALARVRGRASGADADEAILIAPSGVVLEAAGSSVLWWEDDTLCLPPEHLPVLPGVTMALIRERAARLGVPVAHRERTLAELDGREVWLVNALHGIRPVSTWTGRPMTAGPAERAPEWRRWLDEISEPLPDH